MATQLILVRHGVTDWNEQGRLLGRSEVPLNQRGRAQAKAAGEALDALKPARLLSSPQRRTMQTAEEIGAICGLEVEADERLAEIWLRGWQGKTFADLHDDPDVHAYLKDPFHTCDEIEPFVSVQERIRSLMTQFRQEQEASPVVVVSHGDPLRVVVAEAIGLAPGNFRGFSLDNGSVTLVRIGRKQCHVDLLNWRPGDLRLSQRG